MKRRAFTVIELLVVISILALLAAMTVSALANAAEQAKAQRTKAIIAKLDQLIMEKWDGYRTRAVPVRIAYGTSPANAAAIRLNAIRDLMRMELPDRKTDVTSGPADLDPNSASPLNLPEPSVLRGYKRKIEAACGANWTDNATGWTPASQGAECLYLIVSSMRDGEKSGIDFFTPSEIGDTDEDGMREILDGWGRPIEFLRWAPGYVRDPDPSWPNAVDYAAPTHQTRDASLSPDPFDPLKVDGKYALKPLIFSSGPDKEFDVFTDTNLPNYHSYVASSGSDNYPKPYDAFSPDNNYAGQLFDRDGDGRSAFMDNITNHSP